jgi:hypothetical protein
MQNQISSNKIMKCKHNDGNIDLWCLLILHYNELFHRDIHGTILSKKLLANYIIRELNLDNPIHSLMYTGKNYID